MEEMDAQEVMDENRDCNMQLQLHISDHAAVFLANSVRRFPASPGFSAWFFLEKLKDSDARGDDAFNGIRYAKTRWIYRDLLGKTARIYHFPIVFRIF